MANAIIFDTETNGLTPKSSVLSVTAIKIDTDGEELEVFDRFYYPKEPYNAGSINVNGLNKETIDSRRRLSVTGYTSRLIWLDVLHTTISLILCYVGKGVDKYEKSLGE